MRLQRLYRHAETVLLAFLACVILWKGGKGLETTWMLVPIAWYLLLGQWGTRGAESEERRSLDIPWTLWILLILFVLWTCLSFLTSETRNYGLDEVLREGALAMTFLYAARAARSRLRSAENIVTTIALAVLAAVPIGMVIYLVQPVSRFVGTFFDYRFNTDYWPNAWADAVLLGWPLVLWWALRAKDSVEKVLRLCLLGLLLGTLLLSYSRGSFIVFALQLLCLFGGFLWIRLRGPHAAPAITRPGIVAASIVAFIAFIVFVAANQLRSRTFEVESVVAKATFSAAEGRSSVDERSEFWRAAWQLSLQSPLVGHGPYSFRFVQPYLQEGVYVTSDHAHNVILKIAMERGWPAALFFIAFLALIFLRALAVIVRTHSPHRWLASVLVLGAGGVLVHSLIDYNLQFVGIALPLWLMLGILEASHTHARCSPAGRHVRKIVECALLSAFLIVAISEGRWVVVSSFGRHAEARGETETALAWYEAASEEVFSRDLHLSRAALLINSDKPEEALAAVDEYQRLNSHDARAWQIRGEAYRMMRDLDQAQAAYYQAYLRGRYNYLSILEGFVQIMRQRRDEEGFDEFQPLFIDTMGNFAQAIEMNTHFIALSDNVEIFLRLAAVFGEQYPDHEGFFDILAARVDRNAAEERERFSARKPGMLW